MIPLASAARQATPVAGWSPVALLREMLRSWIAHHQRLADLGIVCDL